MRHRFPRKHRGAHVKAKSDVKLLGASYREPFEFFGMPEVMIDAAHRNFYANGQNINEQLLA